MKVKPHIIYGDHCLLLTSHQTDFPLRQLHLKAVENTYCAYKACESVSTHVQSDSSRDYMVADTHNEKHHHIQRASFCEDERDGILRCPEAILHADQSDSFSCEVISETRKMMRHRRPFLHADIRTFRHEVEQHQNSRRFCVSDDEKAQALLPQVVPTYDIENRIVENGLRQWTTNQYPLFLKTAGLFFEYQLNRWIRTRDHWSWFSQTKIKLPKKPLALPHTKINIKFMAYEGG
jgi:hypothetical protein